MSDHKTKNQYLDQVKTDYSGADRNCDIVMKGGITSGVVYPLAICELAKTYRYKNIGGTSAGAIAAAVTAAAEYGRNNGGTSFAQLEALPEWFGKKPYGSENSNLFHLFQPQDSTRGVFNTIISGLLHGKSPGGMLGRMMSAAISAFPRAAIIGAIPGLLLVLLILASGFGLLQVFSLIIALAVILVGLVIALAIKLYRVASEVIPNNYFGLCTGVAENMSSSPPALTGWLADLIDRLAGLKDESDKPLTFGDLRDKGIKLQMMTTNLTHGIPYNLPFDEGIFYFKPDEFRRLFPERIVKWMAENPREIADDSRKRFEQAGCLALPHEDNLPVVFGARLSLSFPILISAIPLYAIDYTRKNEEDRRPERCWFSDGGICSNFPVHYFDNPIPGWPTFAINLREPHPDYPIKKEEADNVWMPKTNGSGQVAWWTRFDQSPDKNRIFSLIGAIKNAMMNWRDISQTSVPGYRDRVVHISVAENEGGLNLNMDPKVITALGERGRHAAVRLADTYTTPAAGERKLSWDNHRWVRYRSTLSLLVDNLVKLYESYENSKTTTKPGEKTYEDLMNDPPSYDWDSEQQRKFAIKITTDLLEVVKEWKDAQRADPEDNDISKDAPRPKPEIRILPRI